MHTLLEKNDINSQELQTLLQERAEGKTDFLLVDVREDMEYRMGHIKGVDMLKPTSDFQQWAQQFYDENKDKIVVFTCRTGNRSAQVQHIFQRHGHKHVLNHFGGIVTYRGDIEQ